MPSPKKNKLLTDPKTCAADPRKSHHSHSHLPTLVSDNVFNTAISHQQHDAWQEESAHSIDVVDVVGEAGAVAARLVVWEGVGGGAVLGGDGSLINEGGVETLNVATISHGDVDHSAGVHSVVLQATKAGVRAGACPF